MGTVRRTTKQIVNLLAGPGARGAVMCCSSREEGGIEKNRRLEAEKEVGCSGEAGG